MEYLGQFLGYQLFRHTDGTLEGWKGTQHEKMLVASTTVKKARQLDRLVTTCTTTEEFCNLVLQMKSKRERTRKGIVDPSQLKIE